VTSDGTYLVLFTSYKSVIDMLAVTLIPIFGAIGYSILYLLLGGGLGGALLIFIVAKALGK